MKSLKIKLPVAFLILCAASYVVFLEVQASEDSDEQISASAVWSPTEKDLSQIDQKCRKSTANYSECFIKQMPQLGASDEAVDFTRSYAEQNHGTVAVLRNFRPVDAVDIGYVYFPAGGELRQGWLLLNGSPSVVNVDDPDLLPGSQMENDPQYSTLRNRHPAVRIFFEDAGRGPDVMPKMEQVDDGGQRFVVEYALKDGCHTCPLLGHASFSFDFDPAGNFLESRFVKVAPLVPASRN